MPTIPRQNDVLFGKGTAINTHYGNKHYRSMVALHQPNFFQSKRNEKREVAKNLVNEIETLGRRFLMEDPNSSRRDGKGGVENQTNPDSSDGDLVTDPLILAKVWVHVEKDKAIEKAMHRLRERRASVGQKQPAEREKMELQPLNTVVYKVDSANGVAAGTQFDAKTCSNNDEEAKVVSNIFGHNETVIVASEKNPVDSFAHLSGPIGIQSTLQPLAHQIRKMDAPVPVSLKYWIKSTGELSSKNDYLESAISLACMLTKRLIQIVASTNISPEEIATEKVIVFVQQNAFDASKLSIKAVHFHFETQGALPLLHSSCPLVSSSPLQSRIFCTLLGNLLLEIFSMGRNEISSGTTHNSNCNNHYGYYANNPPAQKRRAVDPTNVSANSLSSLGMPLSICQLVCDLLVAIDEPCPDLALTSLEQALWDLTQMKNYPQSFLFDRTCPLKALIDTCLFVNTSVKPSF